MRGKKSNNNSAAPAAGLSARPALRVQRAAALLLGAIALVALSGCGSVQTTSYGPASSPESVSDPRPPVISGVPPTAAQTGVPYDYVPEVAAAPGVALLFSIANKPSWATFSTASGELAGIPGAGDVGVSKGIEITVSDGADTASVGPFQITVTAAGASPPGSDVPPTISGTPPTGVVAGQAYLFAPSASDAAGNPLTFVIANRPEWATFDPTTGQLSGTPTTANVGTYPNIVISVSDGALSASLPAFTINVSAAGSGPPTISGSPPAWAVVGTTYTFTPTASDPAGNTLTFAVQNLPSWANFNTSTGQLSGTPGAANVGNFPNIVISVSDGTLSASLPAFSVTVATSGNVPPPVISGRPPPTATVGAAYTFTPSSTDPTGGVLAFSIQNQPSWANFDPASGRLSGTPGTAAIGNDANIVISVTDGSGSASLAPFTITVAAAASSPPSIGGNPPTTATVGAAYNFTPNASDPQGGTLTFSIQNTPGWANFNTSTGQLSGTPAAADVGNYPNIVIRVSDGTLSAALPAFAITVKATSGGPPTIKGNPAASVNVGATYSFTPTASDPEGNSLTFSIQNQPSWASFDPNTGQLSGTPAAANVGTYSNITISVSDGTASASLPSFSIAVNAIATGSLTVNWNPPTQNTNGSQLTNLAGYYIYYGQSPNALTQSQQINNPGMTSYTLSGLGQGTWYIGIVDFNAGGIQSTLSNIASATVQ
jgi:nitrite reductase/ring-hydroxylating ferredoxin subunit